MAMYKAKRLKLIQAEQWFPGKAVPGVFGERDADEGGNGLSPEPAMAFVKTIHGATTKIVAGDYVVTEPDGIHHYPVKAEIFENDYELWIAEISY
jgi:hypothetical protein